MTEAAENYVFKTVSRPFLFSLPLFSRPCRVVLSLPAAPPLTALPRAAPPGWPRAAQRPCVGRPPTRPPPPQAAAAATPSRRRRSKPQAATVDRRRSIHSAVVANLFPIVIR
jgi:hypothetical protein